jgi:hypothetical protein
MTEQPESESHLLNNKFASFNAQLLSNRILIILVMLKFQNRALIFSAIWLEILGLVPAATKTMYFDNKAWAT